MTTIPGDPLGRCWLEGAFEGPHVLDSALISLIAFGPDGAELIGTGFIVGAFGRQALALTAAHNFHHVASIQRPWTTHHPTTPKEFILNEPRPLSIDRRNVRAFCGGKDNMDMCIIGEVSAVKEMDIAVFTLFLQRHIETDWLKHRCSVDFNIPKRGQCVWMLSYADMNLSDESLDEQTHIRMQRRLTLRKGVITDIHTQGVRNYTWPCFETTIPIDSGMSGSPVLSFGEIGDPIVACGVACGGLEHCKDYKVSGGSICSQLWPVSGLSVNATLPEQTKLQKTTVLEFVRRQLIDDRERSAEKISLIHYPRGGVTVRMLN